MRAYKALGSVPEQLESSMEDKFMYATSIRVVLHGVLRSHKMTTLRAILECSPENLSVHRQQFLGVIIRDICIITRVNLVL